MPFARGRACMRLGRRWEAGPGAGQVVVCGGREDRKRKARAVGMDEDSPMHLRSDRGDRIAVRQNGQ